jgi:hypothetical protein
MTSPITKPSEALRAAREPWSVDMNDGERLLVCDGDDNVVATVDTRNYGDREEAIAEARLIATAPELGAALEELLACLMEGVLLGGPNVPIVREQRAKIRAMQALLKAGIPFGASALAEEAGQ